MNKIFAFGSLARLFILLGLSATAFATGLVREPLSPRLPANFHLLSGPQVVVSMPIEVLDGNPASIVLQIMEPPLEMEHDQRAEGTYTKIRLSGEGSTFEEGRPDVPRVSRLLMVENTGQVAVRVLEQSYHEERLTYPPLPAQRIGENETAFVPPEATTYTTDAWYPEHLVEISEPMVLRDVRFVILVVHPVQVNPVTRMMRVYDRLLVAVESVGGEGACEIRHAPTSLTPGFKKLYAMFENFRGSALDALPVLPGKQLFICDNNSAVIDELQKLITWRRKKGIDAYYATLTTIGGNDATLIRNYISSQYTASNGTLEFVTLVGDPGAAAPYGLTTHSSQLDNYFGTMSGGPNPDPLPDIAVGRLPARSLSELQTLVARSVQYEATPYTADTTWFTRAWCAAHTAQVHSNASTKEYTRQIMLQHGMRTVHFTVFPGGMNTTTLQTRIREGVCVFNDRMSWVGEFSNSQLDGLNNGWKLPFVMVITCGTGTFSGGDALSEEWVRRGTASNPMGAIGAVGLSGLGTHVRQNNIVDAGVMWGLYVLRTYEQGIAVIAGKMELHRNYWDYGYQSDVNNFSYWMNLMGDPAVPVWLMTPRPVTVTRPATVHRNTNNITVQVTRGASPVAGVLVGLLKGSETFSRGYTDATGSVNLSTNLPTTGYLYVTVTGEDVDTYKDSILVVTADASLSYHSVAVDDDSLGGTIGNGDGVLNPGETVDLAIRLTNSGTSTTVTGITGVLSTPGPGITIVSGTRSYPNLAVGEVAPPASPFRIQVGAVFHNEPVPFFVTATSSAGTQVVRADLTPVAGDVAFVSSSFPDGNGRLDPGDTGNYIVTFRNSGGRALMAAQGILRSLDNHVIVNDSLGSFGNVSVGGNGVNSTDPFNVTARVQTVGGYRARMLLVITESSGFRDSVMFTQTIGVATTTTPTGPDAYGYYAYDNTETAPPGSASAYNWIEIAPSLGGPGVSLNFTDNGEDQDNVVTQPLPFPFTFYGQTFNQVTICSNGWLAFGSQTNIDFRNYRMGSPLGPCNQVAAYWDDLIVTGVTAGGVYVWSDVGMGRYVVEWRTETLWSHVDQIFQVILYNPAVYPSPTGDGKILVQYHTVNPSANSGSNDNDWATVGIQNADHSIGLEYCYWNVYAPGAAVLANGRAVMYTTDTTGYMPVSLTLVRPNGGEVWYQYRPDTVSWFGGVFQNSVRIELSRNGAAGPWETIVATTPNDGQEVLALPGPASTQCRIRITDVTDPAQTDMSAANFTLATLRVLAPNGGETWYRDSLQTVSWIGGNPAGNVRIDLSRYGAGGPWETMVASAPNTGTRTVTPTGHLSTNCRIRVTSLSDATDTDISDSSFSIAAIQMVFAENFDSGAPGWTHAPSGGRWQDNWHLSTERAYNGTTSFKCGDTGGGNYADSCDALLTSPLIGPLPERARLRFAFQIESEISPSNPDSAYDGGLVEISAGGGSFGILVPEGGYNKTFRYCRNQQCDPYTGPLPGRPCFAGTITSWNVREFSLSAFAGQTVQLRWRFCSDRNTNAEGWYVDNVQVFVPVINPTLPVPQEVTLVPWGNHLILRWAADGNAYYRIYSADSPGGPFDTLVSVTTVNSDTLENALLQATKKFYVVVGWDGQE